MRIVYMGTPDFAVAPLERLVADGHQVVGVFTQPDKPKNRGMKLTMPPVKEAALAHGIPVYQPASMKGEEAFAQLQGLAPQLVVVTAYGQLLPKRVLELPPLGCINVHASLLPDYRGASPIQQVILQGEARTGVTIMQMDRGLDTGDMLYKLALDIAPEETAQTLHDKLALLGADALSQCLAGMKDGTIVPQAQPAECRFYAPLIQKADGHIHFTESCSQIDRMSRALQPWPGVFSQLGGQTMKLFDLRVEPRAHQKPWGSILGWDETGLQVACADGVVFIGQIQAPGGKRMGCAQYFLGHAQQKELCFA